MVLGQGVEVEAGHDQVGHVIGAGGFGVVQPRALNVGLHGVADVTPLQSHVANVVERPGDGGGAAAGGAP